MRGAVAVLALFVGCASSGWMEGEAVNEEIRTVLRSGPGGDMALSVKGGLYAVPAGKLGNERSTLLRALGAAEATPTFDPERIRKATAGRAFREPPPSDEAIHAWVNPEIVEIDYPDGTIRLRRHEWTGYTVELRDRRRTAYLMKLVGSKALDDAWTGLHRSAERGATRQHWVVPALDSSRPLLAVRDALVDERGLGWGE